MMDEPNGRAAYYGFLITLLTEAGLQLEADSDCPHSSRYGEHLAEIRHALEVASVAARFILADLKSDPNGTQVSLTGLGETVLH
jgi:hypothetical protein